MSDHMFQIPEPWEISKLPEIADINMGQSPSSSDVNEHGEGIVFFQGKAEFGKLYPTPKKYCTKPTKIASAGDILLSVRAPVGPTNLANQSTAIGRGLAAISAYHGLMESKYLLYFFKCIEPWLSTQGTGSTFKAISGQFIRDLQSPVPPLAEQKIIAEKLDTLLAQVDSTKARLEQIPQILKRFRQAVLAIAVNGQLTKEWRELSELSAIWPSLTLGELVTIERGSSPRPIKDYITTSESGVNWIKIGDAREGEKYIHSTKEKITPEGAKKSRKVTPGDFILSNSMSLGRAYIVDIEGYVHDGWFILRLPQHIDKNYFYYLLSSSQLQEQFSNLAVGGVVQNIRSELVKQAIVNIPSEKEQAEIVRRVEQLFAYADTIEKQVNNALARVNNLTQSILAKAFRGELTAQWRAENPELISGENSAAALLEKIKAERAASGGKKASRKKS
ncbi:restriction endonuclease subunit S [Escherichia coli]|uniref:restriction endonuclease subunit S n=1 Tax=Escherichia coli TaxID=562 RepID=UPI0010CB0781|nr:restriction endonuclease subunit S [Escherichia coli]